MAHVGDGPSQDPMSRLRSFLESLKRGPVQIEELLDHLRSAWHLFEGAELSGMEAWKLDPMENPRWKPPRLSFTIERHGGAKLGSSRAELQHWKVDISERSAVISRTGHRQLRPRDPPLKVEPLAKSVVEAVSAGRDDPRLKWSEDRFTVTIIAGKVIPDDGPKETVKGRRRRFREALMAEMLGSGWEGGYYSFSKVPNG